MESLGDQIDANEHQERQRQHLDGGMAVHKGADRAGGEEHHQHGNDHCRDHDRDLIDHADCGNDGVERKDKVQQQNLRNNGGERGANSGFGMSCRTFEFLVDLVRRLAHEEEPARDENQIAPRKTAPEDGEQLTREARHPGQRKEQQDTREHSQREADGASAGLLYGRQLTGEDRDENDVVYPKHNLQDGQGDEADERICRQ